MDDQAVEKLTEQLSRLSDILENMSGSATKAGDAFNKVGESLKRNEKANKDAALGAEKLAKASDEAASIAEENARVVKKNLEAASMDAGRALRSFTTSLLSGIEGFAKYGDALKTLGSSAFELSKNFGLAGQAVGFLIQTTTKLASAYFEQLDLQVKFRDTISKVGGVGAGTTKELSNLAREAGYTSKDLAKLTKPMQTAGEAMAAMNNNAESGAKTFLKVADVGMQVRMQFQRLGVSQEELTTIQASFLESQKLSGYAFREQAKDTEKLKKQSVEYAENLVKLSTLTGKTAQSIQKEQDQVKSEFEELVKKRAESAKIKALDDKEKVLRAEGKTVEADAVKKQKEAIEIEVENRRQMIEDMTGKFDTEMGSMLAKVSRTGTFDTSTAGLARLGLSPAEIKAKMQSMTSDEERKEFFQELQDRINKNTDKAALQSETALQYMGEQNAKALGIFKSVLVRSAGQQGKSAKEMADTVNKGFKTQGALGSDLALDARGALTEAELGARKAVDSLTGAATAAALALTVLATSQGLKALGGLKGLAGSVGGMAGGAGGAAGGAGGLAKAAGTVGKTLIKGAGIAAVGSLVGSGAEYVGEKVGGTTGKVISGAGTVAQYAAMGALLGPVGALVGGVAGLGKAIWDNTKVTKTENELQQESQISDKEKNYLAKRQIEVQTRLQEESKKLKEILGTNAFAMSEFAGKLDTMGDEEFKKLTEELKRLGKISEKQVQELAKERERQQKATAKTKESEKKEEEKRLERKKPGEEAKFGEKEQKELSAKEEELKEIQKQLAEAKTAEDKKILEGLLKTYTTEIDLLNKKKKANDEFEKQEDKRIEAEKKSIAETKKAAEFREKAQRTVAGKTATTAAVAESLKITKESLSRSGGTAPAGAPATSAPPAAGAAPAVASTPVGGAGGAGGGQDKSTGLTKEGLGAGSTAPPVAAIGSTAKGGSMTEQEAKAMTMRHEGVRYEPYKDSLGLWTVGVGHLIGDGRTLPAAWNRKFSHEEVMALYDKDYEEHKKAAQSNVPGFNKFDSLGKAALVDLTFNMGPGWAKKFPNTSRKLEAGDSQGAAAGLMDSLWYQQVKSRGPTIVEMVKNSKVSAKDGGLATGPESGYPATLHGSEMIVPFEPNSILEKISKTTASTSDNVQSLLPSPSKQASSADNTMIREMVNSNVQMYNLLAEKLDTVIDTLGEGNATNRKLLKTQMI